MNDASLWYAQLTKPAWAPPAWVFGPVWTVLYVLIAISFGWVLIQAVRKVIPWSVTVPFIINIIANVAYSPIQFQLRNNTLASIDIFIVLITILWAMVAIHGYYKWVSYIQIPYLLWVSFATGLQFTITFLNW